MAFVLALDQGTTSSRAIVFDRSGSIRALAQREFAQHFPQPGWVEHDANEIWTTQSAVMGEALAKAAISGGELAAIGITNQRETTVLWERATGKPVARAIVWQDRRTADICDALRAAGHADLFTHKTGLVLDAYFSGTKLKWLLDHVGGARERAQRGELAFGTVDSWLIWNLSRGATHVTDASNASRTLLFNIHTGDWDDELLALLDVPRAVLPTVVASSGICAECRIGDATVPIAGIAGDQQAALFGQACLAPGLAKNTYGTGCFLLLNTGHEIVESKNKLVSTVAWRRSSGIFGLTRGSSAAHIARAALESIAYQSAEILSAMEADAHIKLAELRVDGGAAANNLLMQFQADLLGVPVVRPKVLETTALGAAYLAGLAVGYWRDEGDIGANWQVDRRFEPAMSRDQASQLTANWTKAVERAKNWA